jgi:hypothetical protein
MDHRRHKNKRNPDLSNLVSDGVDAIGGEPMTSPTRIIEGTTFAWTERYGAALSARARAIEVGRDVVFAITLAVLTAGAVGFVTHAPSSERMARTVESSRSL